MRIRHLAGPAAYVLILALAGCGNGSSSAAGSPSGSAALTAAPAVTIMVLPDPATIGAYAPPSATARVGDTVRWNFVDKNPHTVTADAAGGFNSRVQSSGKSFSFIFRTSGTYRYHCNIHPEMHGAIVVS